MALIKVIRMRTEDSNAPGTLAAAERFEKQIREVVDVYYNATIQLVQSSCSIQTGPKTGTCFTVTTAVIRY